jgi:putative transposase
LLRDIHINHNGKDATMKERTKQEPDDRGNHDSRTDLIRAGAQELSAHALKVEVAVLLATFADQQDEQSHSMVVHNGHHPTREIQPGIGPMTVQVPKVRSR